MQGKRGGAKKAPLKKARAQRVASGLVAGKTKKAIAADIGVSRQTVTTLASTPEVQHLLADMIDRRRLRTERLLDLSLDAIEDALHSAVATSTEKRNVSTITEDGEVVKEVQTVTVVLGPDHYARLQAVRRLQGLLEAGRPTPKPVEGEKGQRPITLQDLEALLNRAKGTVQ